MKKKGQLIVILWQQMIQLYAFNTLINIMINKRGGSDRPCSFPHLWMCVWSAIKISYLKLRWGMMNRLYKTHTNLCILPNLKLVTWHDMCLFELKQYLCYQTLMNVSVIYLTKCLAMYPITKTFMTNTLLLLIIVLLPHTSYCVCHILTSNCPYHIRLRHYFRLIVVEQCLPHWSR